MEHPRRAARDPLKGAAPGAGKARPAVPLDEGTSFVAVWQVFASFFVFIHRSPPWTA